MLIVCAHAVESRLELKRSRSAVKFPSDDLKSYDGLSKIAILTFFLVFSSKINKSFLVRREKSLATHRKERN